MPIGTEAGGVRLQKADEADHTDLEGDHEWPVLREKPPRAGCQFLSPGPVSRPRSLAREGETAKRENSAEEEGPREEA